METERELYQTLHDTLLACRIHPGEAPWLAAQLARAVSERFRVQAAELPTHEGFRRDLMRLLGEIFAHEEIQAMPEEERAGYAADYLLGALDEKYRFTVRLDWYRSGGVGR